MLKILQWSLTGDRRKFNCKANRGPRTWPLRLSGVAGGLLGLSVESTLQAHGISPGRNPCILSHTAILILPSGVSCPHPSSLSQVPCLGLSPGTSCEPILRRGFLCFLGVLLSGLPPCPCCTGWWWRCCLVAVTCLWPPPVRGLAVGRTLSLIPVCNPGPLAQSLAHRRRVFPHCWDRQVTLEAWRWQLGQMSQEGSPKLPAILWVPSLEAGRTLYSGISLGQKGCSLPASPFTPPAVP